MAKESKSSSSKKRGQPKGGSPAPSTKTGRLLMRVHADLLPLIDVHARERAMTRTQFVEQMLVGFLRLDPRAPRINAFGQLEAMPEGTPPPIQIRPGAFPRAGTPPNPHIFLRRWDEFRKASELVTGYRPPDSLIEDYVMMGPSDAPEDDLPLPPGVGWGRRPPR